MVPWAHHRVVDGIFVYLELVTQWSFRAPPKRKPALVDEAWERMTIDANGCGIAYYLHKGQPGALWFGFATGGRLEPSVWFTVRQPLSSEDGMLSWSTSPVWRIRPASKMECRTGDNAHDGIDE